MSHSQTPQWDCLHSKLVVVLRHHVIYQEEIYGFRRSEFSILWMVAIKLI